jgi:hypothetical protein
MNKKYIVILAVLAVAIFAFGAHFATAGPVEIQVGETTISFLPLIIHSKAADAPPGVLYVFNTGAETSGNIGGRSIMGEICTNEDPESHFCSIEEIEHARTTNGVYYLVDFAASWVDVIDASQGAWSDIGLNCAGWSSENDQHTGFVLSAFAASLDVVACDSSAKVACCKQIP